MGGPRPTIVLVHGDWADASTWTSVIERLQDKGFTVVAPPNLLRGPAADAAYLASYLHSISAPIVLVAHSYGGFVTTNAARGNPNVKALVYIDSFMPDEGEIGGVLVADWGSGIDEVDVLRDDGEAYAARLRSAGVEVTTVRYDGITHDFMMLTPLSNTCATRAAVAQAIAILRDALQVA